MENPEPQPQPEPTQEAPTEETETKDEQKLSPKAQNALRKQKKKKLKALNQFLAKPQTEVIEVPRRKQQEEGGEPSQPTTCKICGDLSQKRKLCEFCKQQVCTEHFRKKRKHKTTGKFVRICDECEDKYLTDKYMNLETKAEEAIIMQEMIIQGKHDELNQIIGAKQVKVGVLKAKKKELQEQKKQQDHRIKIQDNEINHKQKKLQVRQAELRALDESIVKLEESLPRPLDEDHNCLIQQNNKINKELLKYQKLCSEALKAKSVRQKELYEAFYKWEKKENTKSELSKKKDDCLIY